MSVLMWHVGDDHGTPMSADQPLQQTGPIRTDGADVDLDRAPDFNEITVDRSGELTGLTKRNVAGDVKGIEKYAPWWADLSSLDFMDPVTTPQAQKGYAAAKELTGEQGHGTMYYRESIEPVLRDNQAMGNDYFLSNPLDANEGSGQYMQPGIYDNVANRQTQARANANSRSAFLDSTYRDFLDNS